MPFVLWVPLFSLLIFPQSPAEVTVVPGDLAESRIQKTQFSQSFCGPSYLVLPAFSGLPSLKRIVLLPVPCGGWEVPSAGHPKSKLNLNTDGMSPQK